MCEDFFVSKTCGGWGLAGAIPSDAHEAVGGYSVAVLTSGGERSAFSKFLMRMVGLLLLAKLLSSQSTQSALSWGVAFFAHCVVSFVMARPKR